MTASSMSWKRPVTCGRIASCTNAPASAAHWPRRSETVKWLVQNQTSRSRNGVFVVTALPIAASPGCDTARAPVTVRRRLFLAVGAQRREPFGRDGRIGRAGLRVAWRSWFSSQAVGSAGGGCVPAEPNPKRTRA